MSPTSSKSNRNKLSRQITMKGTSAMATQHRINKHLQYRAQIGSSRFERGLWSDFKKLNLSYKKILKKKMNKRRTANQIHTSENYTNFWLKTVLPHWQELKGSPIVKYFWETNGIPERLRGDIWFQAIGDGLKLQHKFKMYDIAASQKEINKEIMDDLTRIDPDMKIEKKNNTYRILAAYCEYVADEEHGVYIQFMPFIVLLLLEYMPIEQAFTSFVNM
eukprot:UN28433